MQTLDELFDVVQDIWQDFKFTLKNKAHKFLQAVGLRKKDLDPNAKPPPKRADRTFKAPAKGPVMRVRELKDDMPPPLSEEQKAELAELKAEIQATKPPPPPEPKLAHPRFRENLNLSRPGLEPDPMLNDKRSIPGCIFLTGGPTEAVLVMDRFHRKAFFSGKYFELPTRLVGNPGAEDTLWEHEEGGRWLYLNSVDKWMFTEDYLTVGSKRGQLHSVEKAKGRQPWDMEAWQYNSAGQWVEDPAISCQRGNQLPSNSASVIGVYLRLNMQVNHKPVYQRVLGRYGDQVYECRPVEGQDAGDLELGLPGMVQGWSDIDSQSSVGDAVAAGGSRFAQGSLAALGELPEVWKTVSSQHVPDEGIKYLSYSHLGYWCVGLQIGSTGCLMRCSSIDRSISPDGLGGHQNPWYVFDDRVGEYVSCPQIMAFRTGTYNEFHFQTVVRTRIRKPEKAELLAERYHDLREEKLVAHEKFDAEAAAARGSHSNVGSRKVYEEELEWTAKGRAMLADPREQKCFYCHRKATSVLLIVGGCEKLRAPRCIFCAQVEAKEVVNPEYDRIIAERKKKAREEEEWGPQGKELSFKERKALEKKQKQEKKTGVVEEEPKEDDRKYIPAKCKFCKTEIMGFGSWDPYQPKGPQHNPNRK